jgi:2-oxo-3-hexenedioate decarboxylase/2-keto-4-pentenoate hydratase
MDVSPTRVARAAAELADRRAARAAFDGLPDELVPRDQVDAYAVQDALHPLLRARGWGRVVGHKIGCTTAVMQRYLGISQPAGGTIYAATVHGTPARLRCADYVRPGVECELAVWLARDLGDADLESPDPDAIKAVALAIEVVDDRYVDYSSLAPETLIADDFFGAGCVLGNWIEPSRVPELGSVTADMLINGGTVGSGSGADILGDPLAALVWLAGELRGRGRTLGAGEFVLLGSVVQTSWIEPGDDVVARSPELGCVRVRFD